MTKQNWFDIQKFFADKAAAHSFKDSFFSIADEILEDLEARDVECHISNIATEPLAGLTVQSYDFLIEGRRIRIYKDPVSQSFATRSFYSPVPFDDGWEDDPDF